MDLEEIEVPVHHRFRDKLYSGLARYRAGWHHIHVTGRRLATGGWDSVLADREMGDDKFAITEAHLDELRAGRSVRVEIVHGLPTTIHPGEYAPEPDGRAPGHLS